MVARGESFPMPQSRDTLRDTKPPEHAPEAVAERHLEPVPEERLSVGVASLAKEVKVGGVYKEGTNQDSHLASKRIRLFGVFDGMGAYAGSKESSQLAAEKVDEIGARASLDPSFLELSKERPESRGFAEELGALRSYIGATLRMEPSDFMSEQQVEDMVSQGILFAHEAVKAHLTEKGQKEGGTTASILTFYETPDGGLIAKIANVGDSRVYRLRKGKLEQLTKDDSFYNWLVSRGYLTGKESPNDPLPEEVAAVVKDAETVGDLRSRLAKALGQQEDELEFEIQSAEAQEGDLFIILTDGVYGNLTHEQMQARLQKLQTNSPDVIAAALAEYARQEARTGRVGTHPDDATDVVVRVNKSAPLAKRFSAIENKLQDKFTRMDDDQLYRETARVYSLRNQVEFAQKRPDVNPKLELLHAHLMRVLQMIDAQQRKLGSVGKGEVADTILSA